MEPPKIKVELGYTLNTGDYESLRIHVGLEDHARIVDGEKEKIDKAFERIYSIVEEQLKAKLNEAKTLFK